MDKNFQIAIDGPVGAGKSTIAKRLAEKLGFLYVYTGAMYRAAALLAKEKGVDWEDGPGLAEVVESMEMKMSNTEVNDDQRLINMRINGRDISSEIMDEEVGEGASVVGQHEEVRNALVKKQKEIAEEQDVVMEGRDTTTRVLPDAQVKIYLTASEKERAKRRYKQLLKKGEGVEFAEILSDLRKRDKRDKNRSLDPLQVVEGAWVLDTSDLTINQVVEKIVDRVEIERNL